MKTIGMIGGVSWESTHEYYHLINREVNNRLGGTHSARIRMYSFDFAEIMEYLRAEDNKKIGKRLVEESRKLEKAGAEVLMLCANTAHRWAEKVTSKVNIPLIHIADATGQAIKDAGLGRVLLLGTNYTMEHDFIKGRLADGYGIEVIIPGREDREDVSRIIYDELIRGKFLESSKSFLLDVIGRHPHAQGVVLGCTELPLVVKDEDVEVPLFNTTKLHAMAVVDVALSDNNV